MKINEMKRLLERQLDLWERLEEVLKRGGEGVGGEDEAIEKASALCSVALTELERAVGPKAPRPAAAKQSRYPNVYWNEAKKAWVGRVVVKGRLLSFGGSQDEDRTWTTFLNGLEREGHGAIAGELVRRAGLGDREIGR